MLAKLILLGFLAWLPQAIAEVDNSAHCDRLYQQMKAKTSSDPQSCIPTVGETEPFEQCVKPYDYFGERQASHVVLILDASGSMAGKINGQSKMSVAKQESASFLRDLAADLPVGLMVYGHKGSNDGADKQQSCETIDMLLPIGKNRQDISAKIASLKPTGWTPLAGALAHAESELGNQPPVKEGVDSVPVVYLVSDGEETCDGDPIAAAKSLHESGVQAVVNVIGFDVDEATRTQLEAISSAGGGKFFPAKDAKALRDHLNAAKRAERSHVMYQTCIFDNEFKAISPIYQALQGMPACMSRASYDNFSDVILKQVNALSTPEDKACFLKLTLRTNRETAEIFNPLNKAYNKLLKDQKAAGEAARASSIENALPPER